MQPTDILAGPILRRVERDLVTVWVALSSPGTVDVELFRGQGPRTSLGPAVARKPAAADTDTRTIRVGEHLHIVVSIWEAAEAAGLDPGEMYSYDIVVKLDGDAESRLGDLGLLTDHATAPAWLALGYQDGWLPSFATVPNDIADLRIIQGSCRGSTETGRERVPADRRPHRRRAHRRDAATAPAVPHRRPDLRRRIGGRAARRAADGEPLPHRRPGDDHGRLPRQGQAAGGDGHVSPDALPARAPRPPAERHRRVHLDEHRLAHDGPRRVRRAVPVGVVDRDVELGDDDANADAGLDVGPGRHPEGAQGGPRGPPPCAAAGVRQAAVHLRPDAQRQGREDDRHDDPLPRRLAADPEEVPGDRHGAARRRARRDLGQGRRRRRRRAVLVVVGLLAGRPRHPDRPQGRRGGRRPRSRHGHRRPAPAARAKR